MFDLVFELGRWRARVSPFVAEGLGPEDTEHDDIMFENWRYFQRKAEVFVEALLQDSTEHARNDVWDPRAGQGWRWFGLTKLLDSHILGILRVM